METPFDLLQHLASMLEELELPYAVGGSVAAMVYGEPRSTRDVDVVVSLREEDVPRLKEKFPSPEYYFDTETAREAIREGGQFNIIHDASGIKIDVYIPSDPIAHQQIVRARRTTGTTPTSPAPKSSFSRKWNTTPGAARRSTCATAPR